MLFFFFLTYDAAYECPKFVVSDHFIRYANNVTPQNARCLFSFVQKRKEKRGVGGGTERKQRVQL